MSSSNATSMNTVPSTTPTKMTLTEIRDKWTKMKSLVPASGMLSAKWLPDADIEDSIKTDKVSLDKAVSQKVLHRHMSGFLVLTAVESASSDEKTGDDTKRTDREDSEGRHAFSFERETIALKNDWWTAARNYSQYSVPSKMVVGDGQTYTSAAQVYAALPKLTDEAVDQLTLDLLDNTMKDDGTAQCFSSKSDPVDLTEPIPQGIGQHPLVFGYKLLATS